MTFPLLLLVSPLGIGTLIKKTVGMVTIASCLLACAASHAANPWDGKFRALAEKNKQQMSYWNVEVRCDHEDKCSSTTVMDVVFTEPIHAAIRKEAPYSGALPYNESITSRTRAVIARGVKKDNGKGSETQYDRSIYRQIARPDNVLECRGASEENPATICRLSGELIGSADRKSAWMLLVPDMDPNGVCPNSFCPVVLYKQGSL